MKFNLFVFGFAVQLLIISLSINVAGQANLNRGGPIPKTGDEFTGPFKSWLNAKTGFGAKGNGTTDDTRALQAAFDATGTGTNGGTLYLPAGTYLISHTLQLNSRIFISIIGDGPATTVIKWAGAANGTMLEINGTAYSRFNRITWNGNKIAGIAVEQSWDGRQGTFDTSNEYADDFFVDVAFGIHGGSRGHGFAETSILRDRFIRNTTAGVSLGNFNALDIWIRNSLFQDCATGVTNIYGAGNYRVYHCVFRNSTTSDMTMYNTGGFSARYNTSFHSRQFFYAGITGNPSTTIIEGNTVIDPVNTQVVTVSNQGPILFVRNIIRSAIGANGGPAAVFSCNHNSDVFCMGNIFTIADPLTIDGYKIAYDNKSVDRNSLGRLAENEPPVVEVQLKRKIFEVPPGADAGVIQNIINQAIKFSGNRPVIHFPYGNYNINTTLTIPANTDLQLVGDGYGASRTASMLTWSGNGNGPIISIPGPAKATLRDLTLKGDGSSTNILITNADQAGSRVFLQGFNQKSGGTGMLVNQLDRTLIFGYDTEFSGLKKAISVTGGPLAKAGKAANGRTIIYSGAESNNSLSNEVTDGGNLTVQDTWYEGGIKSTYVKLEGKGFFTAAGDKIATPRGTDVPSVLVQNFSGRAAFIADDLNDRFSLNGNCSNAKILLLGMMAEDYPIIADTAAPKADLREFISRTRINFKNAVRSGSFAVPDIGTYDQLFINDMVGDMLKVHPVTPAALPKGITDVRIYRVMSVGGAKGIDIEGGN